MIVDFKFKLHDKVYINPIESYGVITMCCFGDGGNIYYVQANANNSYWIEEMLSIANENVGKLLG